MNKELLEKLGLLSNEEEYDKFIPTGSYALNKIISGDYNGGVPIGGIVEFYGESSTAKTVFVTSILTQAQKLGYYTKLLDTERSYSAKFARMQGLDPEKLLYSAPDSLEETFEDIEKTISLIREQDKKTPIVIGLDSLAVIPVKKELEDKGFDQSETMGMIRAKVLGACLRKLNPLLRPQNVTLLVVNQLRSKMALYGSPDTKAAGGRSLQFYCAVCLETKSNKKDIIKDENEKSIGIQGRIVNTKNKVSIPFQECEFELIFDKGLTPDYGLIEQLCVDGLLDDKSSKGWVIIEGQKMRKKDVLDKVRAGQLPEIEKLVNLCK